MLTFASATQVYVAADPVDIRKGIDSLAGWVDANGLDPYSGHIFGFLSRRRTHLKARAWSRGGFLLLIKRLEAGHFSFPERTPGADTVAIDATELAMMLDGIEVQRVQRPRVWQPSPRGIDKRVRV